MAQHDYVISNGTGAAVRSDLNNALSAIVTQNSGSTEPTTTYAYQMWADTNAGVMKIRNGANSAWITLYQLDGEWTSIAFENGSAAAPSIYFKDSGTDTGFFSGGTDQVNIATAGTERVEWGTSEVVFNDAGNNYDFRVEGDTNANLLFVDASADAVGIGTSSVASKLTVAGTQGNYRVDPDSVTNEVQLLTTVPDNSGFRNYRIRSNQLFLETSGSTALTIDTSQRVGIGVTSVSNTLHIKQTGDTYGDGIAIQAASGTARRLYIGVDHATGEGAIGTDTHDLRLEATGARSVTFKTNGSERARVDSSGRWLLGTSSARTDFASSTATPRIQQEATDYNGSSLSLVRNSNNGGNGELIFGKSRGTSLGGVTVVAADDTLGGIRFDGADGTDFATGALISAQVDGTPGNNDMPGRLVFSTTADGASSPTERARITNAGYFKATSTGDYFSSTATSHELRNGSSGDWTSVFTHTHGSNPFGIRVYYPGAAPNGTANGFFVGEDSSAVRFVVRSNGGIANYQANNINLSDINTKKDISPAAGTWDCIKEWEIVNYRYKDQPDNADLNLGVIAQQVVESCPEVITVFEEAKDDQPEKLGVKEQQMYWMAIKALQEAQVRIEQLEARLTAAGIE